jgi:hypothetical protein
MMGCWAFSNDINDAWLFCFSLAAVPLPVVSNMTCNVAMCDSDIVIGYDSMFVGCFRGYLTTTM